MLVRRDSIDARLTAAAGARLPLLTECGYVEGRINSVRECCRFEFPAAVVDRVDADAFDLVLVALRRDHLPLVDAQLTKLSEHPLVLFFGNNPTGRAGVPAEIRGPTAWASPASAERSTTVSRNTC
jgi:hypothetical protein